MSRQDTGNPEFLSGSSIGGDPAASENAASLDPARDTGDGYRLVVENASQGIVIANRNTIRYANRKISEYSGYTFEELTSRPFIELIHPDDREAVIKQHQDVFLGTLSSASLSHRIIDREGRVKWIEVTGVPFTWEGTSSTLLFINEVTAQKEIEEQLRQSEERLRDLVEHTGDLIYITDGEGNFKFINQTIEREYGYSAAELLGKRFKDIVTPESYIHAIETFRKQVKGIDVGIVEYSLYDKNGRIRTIEAKERLVWEGDRAVEIYGIARDVTDRKRAEQALRESEEKHRLILENAVEGIAIAYETELGYVNLQMSKYIGYTREELLERPFIDFIYPDDREEVIRTHLALIQGSNDTITSTLRFVARDGTVLCASYTSVPVMWGERRAVLSFVRDVTEEKRVQDELAESEERYRIVVENAEEVIIVAVDGYVTFFNKKTLEVFGYSAEELASVPVIDFVHPDDRELVLSYRNSRESGESGHQFFTARMLTKDGTTIWMENSIVPFSWRGKPAAFVIAVDITERKQIEDALRDSEEKYRLLVENGGEGITIGQDGLTRFANRAVCTILGYSVAELIARPIIDFLHPDDRQMVLDHHMRRITLQEEPGPYLFRAITKTGDVVWFENNAVLIDWEGRPATLNFLRDVTEEKKIEDALRESEEKYRLVVENANEIIVITRDGIVEFANNRVMTLFGVNPSVLVGKHLSELVIGADRGRLNDELQKLIDRVTVLPYYRYRMRDAEGNIRSIEVNGIPITWEGKPAILSFVADITEKVRAEEELKRRLRYEQAVAYCSQELVSFFDLEETLQRVVERLQRTAGFGCVFICKNFVDPVEGLSTITINEAKAEGIKSTVDPPKPLAYRYLSKELWDALNSGRWFGGPTKNHPPVEQEILKVLGCLSSIRLPVFVDGAFWGFVGFDDYQAERIWDEQDILLLQTVASMIGTALARKEAETALIESEKKYRELVDSTSDMIYVADFKGNVKFVNDAVRQLGYEPDELIGTNFYDYYAPSSRKYAQELFRLQRSGVRIHGYELDLVRKDGQTRTIEFNEDIKWEGGRIVEVRGIGRDVTDRKKMEDRLRLVAEGQETVLNSLPDMVFFADVSLKITWANSKTAQLTKLSVEEIVGRFCHEVFSQKGAPCEGCPASASLASGRTEINDAMPCFGKNRRITAYPVPDLSGNITGIAVSIGGIKSRNLLEITESLSQLDEEIEEDAGSETFLAPLDPNYIYPFSLFIDFQKDAFVVTLRWDEYLKEHVLKRLTRSESAVARLVFLAARMKADGSGWVDKDAIRAGTMDTNLNKLRSLLEESNVPFLDRFSARMLIRSNREEKKKVRLALSASNIEISPNVKQFRSKKHRYMDAVLRRIRTIEREIKKSNQPKGYLTSELAIQRQNEVNLKKSIEVVETLFNDSIDLLKL